MFKIGISPMGTLYIVLTGASHASRLRAGFMSVLEMLSAFQDLSPQRSSPVHVKAIGDERFACHPSPFGDRFTGNGIELCLG